MSTQDPGTPPPSAGIGTLPLPPVVDAAAWEVARAALAAEEAAHHAAALALAAKRRRMPMTPVKTDYRFRGPGGEVGLAELFAGRRQLITYKFFYAPDVVNWPDGACSGCSMFADSVTHPAHLAARDVSLAILSDAPPERIATYQRRMGWDLPWYSLIGDAFSRDFGVEEWFGLNVFLRDDAGAIHRTYFLNGPPVEAVGPAWSLLELTPYGRQETSEDSPAGWPQDEPYAWYRLHDAYGEAAQGSG